MYWAYDTMFIEKIHSDVHRLPSWVNSTVLELCGRLIVDINKFFYAGFPVSQMVGGPILKDIMDRFSLKVACMGSSSPNCTWINGLKYFVYSAHDDSVQKVMSALGTMGAMPRAMPMYAGAVFWELWREDDGALTLRHFYKDGAHTDNITTFTVPGCPSYACPLTTVKSIIAPFMVEDPMAMCRSDKYARGKFSRVQLRESAELLRSAGPSGGAAACRPSAQLTNSVTGLAVVSALLLVILIVMTLRLKRSL